MKKVIKISALLLFLMAGKIAIGQTDKDKAIEMGKQAIKLEDDGKYDDARKLLNKAIKLDADDYNYPYEIGYSYFLEKDYKKAVGEFKKVVKMKSATDQLEKKWNQLMLNLMYQLK